MNVKNQYLFGKNNIDIDMLHMIQIKYIKSFRIQIDMTYNKVQ